MNTNTKIIIAVIVSITALAIVSCCDDSSAEIPTDIEGQYYDQLSDASKIIYDAVADAEAPGEKKVTLRGTYNTNQIQSTVRYALNALLLERPDKFWVNPNMNYEYLEGTNINPTITLNINKTSDCKDIDNETAEINAAIKAIVISGTTDAEMVKSIHDELISRLSYDTTLSKTNIRNLYGALVINEVVCEGYAKAFKTLCDKNGIECILVSGTGDTGTETEGHMWNMVKIEGRWYGMDVTWDDTAHTNGFYLAGSKTVINGLTFEESHTPDTTTEEFGFTIPEMDPEAYSKRPANTYRIIWNNWDGTVLKTENYTANTIPEYHGDLPKKPDTTECRYIFSDWSPAVVAIVADTTYTAQYDQIPLLDYIVTWYNYDGSVLDFNYLDGGSTPIYDGKTPTKEGDQLFSYSFLGWSPAPSSINEDVSYTAEYRQNFAFLDADMPIDAMYILIGVLALLIVMIVAVVMVRRHKHA